MTSSLGVEMMKRIHEGSIQKVTNSSLKQVKQLVCDGLEEILDVGARVRPLMVGDSKVGWVRGVYPSERQVIRKWCFSDVEFIRQLLSLGTSLSPADIANLSLLEMRSVVRVIQEMTDLDLGFYPYISAFTTTSISEQLWFSASSRILSSRKSSIELPDGATVHLQAPADHTKLWAQLCHYREQHKSRLEANQNALLIIRPWVGKNANSLASDLQNAANNLITDIDDPWSNVVKVRREIDLNDGWAHGGDDNEDSLRREWEGILSKDKHEQFMSRIAAQQKEAAAAQLKRTEDMVREHGTGIFASKTKVYTPKEMEQRMKDLRRGVPPNLVRTDFQSKSEGPKIFDRYE